jgi:hypothetical protein
MVEFRENRAGIEEMLRAPYMVEAMKHRAELARIRAEQIAPVQTGAYAFGLPGRPGSSGGGFHVDAGIRAGRAYARLWNLTKAPPSANFPEGYAYSWALEFGNKRMKKQRILGRAIDAMSGRG